MVIVLGVMGAAMFVSENGEEVLHLYRDIRGDQAGKGRAQKPAADQPSGMELHGRWRGMSLVPADSPAARRLGSETDHGAVVDKLSPQNGWLAQSAGVQVEY